MSAQPLHAMPTEDWVFSVQSRLLYENSFAWKTFADAECKMVFGSEWPVTPLSVTHGISHLTVTRIPFVSGGVDQRISFDSAIKGYTAIPAGITADDERNLGLIAEGFLADFVLLSESTVTEFTFPQVTVCGGKVTYSTI